MICPTCNSDAELTIGQERDYYVGTIFCRNCGASGKGQADTVCEVLQQLERTMKEQ